MEPRDRLLRTLAGEPVDRIPVYTQIPFGLTAAGFKPAPFHGYEDYDDWRTQDPAYWRLVRRMEAECDNFFIWRPPCMLASNFFTPASVTRSLPPAQQDGWIVTTTLLEAGGRTLRTVSAVQPGRGHTWVREPYCKGPEDAELLLHLPWQGAPAEPGDFFRLQQLLGGRGVMWVTVPSPITVVCGLFGLTEFLILMRTHGGLIYRLQEAAAERVGANLEALLKAGVGPVIRFGGAEHLTPPLASPRDFDALAVAYDAPLTKLVKRHGCMVAVHCHGHIRHALARFVEMGVDQTDPVEQEPDGDLTLAEARAIAARQITLTGNLQMRELAVASPDYIRERVRQIIRDAGPDRLILTTTGAPLERIPPAIEANYNAFIDAALEYGAA